MAVSSFHARTALLRAMMSLSVEMTEDRQTQDKNECDVETRTPRFPRGKAWGGSREWLSSHRSHEAACVAPLKNPWTRCVRGWLHGALLYRNALILTLRGFRLECCMLKASHLPATCCVPLIPCDPFALAPNTTTPFLTRLT